MTPKIEKINAELDKAKKKISEIQDHVQKLEQQKTELENTNILGLVRSAGMTPQELSALIQACLTNSDTSQFAQNLQEDNNNE